MLWFDGLILFLRVELTRYLLATLAPGESRFVNLEHAVPVETRSCLGMSPVQTDSGWVDSVRGDLMGCGVNTQGEIRKCTEKRWQSALLP